MIVSVPTISGTARVGERLTGEHGDWSGGVTSYAYQWQRCNAAGASCVNIPARPGPNGTSPRTTQATRCGSASSRTNGDGASAPAFSAPSAVVQPAVAPAITRLPAITGTARVGQTLTTDRGEWANNPTSYAYQWSRCNADGRLVRRTSRRERADPHPHPWRPGEPAPRHGHRVERRRLELRGLVRERRRPGRRRGPRQHGGSDDQRHAAGGSDPDGRERHLVEQPDLVHAPVAAMQLDRRLVHEHPGETGQTRIVANDDVGNRLRVVVTARNAVGSSSANSNPTEVIATGLPAGAIRLPSGRVSIPVTSVTLPERLIVETVRFNPNPVRSRAPITVQFRVADTRGYIVRDALVFVRSTPLVTSTPPETATAAGRLGDPPGDPALELPAQRQGRPVLRPRP